VSLTASADANVKCDAGLRLLFLNTQSPLQIKFDANVHTKYGRIAHGDPPLNTYKPQSSWEEILQTRLSIIIIIMSKPVYEEGDVTVL